MRGRCPPPEDEKGDSVVGGLRLRGGSYVAQTSITYVEDMIPDERQRTLMNFIQEANRGGHDPVKREVLEWLDRPGFRPGKRGKMITPENPGVASVPNKLTQALLAASLAATNFQTPEMTRTLKNARKKMIGGLTPSVQSSIANAHRTATEFYGIPGTSARYGPDGPPEDSVKQLLRFRWIEHVGKGKGLNLTGLGKALLKAALLDSGVGDTDVLVLAAQDAFAWGKLLGHISGLEDCLIVDSYLKEPELSQIIEHTTAQEYSWAQISKRMNSLS